MVSFIEMRNNFKTIVTLSNLGASIYDIKTVDKDNKIESILYTTKKEEDFITERSYLGKTIGRTGGRISNSKFKLNDIEYVIKSNDPNGLHGGIDGVSYKEFEYHKVEAEDYFEVKFSYYSNDLESGYPGDLIINVIYRLYKNINKLTVTYDAIASKDTLVNLSNHSYFNLSGNSKDNILNHELYINASKMERIEKLIPQEIVDCKEIYSFKNMHKIGDYINDKEIIDNTNGYDYPYIFDDDTIDKFNVLLKDDNSKRILKIKTSYPTVVVYTCNYTEDKIMNNGEVMTPYYAVCLECMYHPNTINSDFLKEKKDILLKNKKYKETIEYYFGVEND
ncbi:MAG: galactose mutarotase [Acholeplasmatales bacterium]|nr:galactose mutarotase [Acholeplasmatales bacterium]